MYACLGAPTLLINLGPPVGLCPSGPPLIPGGTIDVPKNLVGDRLEPLTPYIGRSPSVEVPK
jgi:hypothetical protein